MSQIVTYLFYPNPGSASYGSPKVILALILCIGLIAGSFALRAWRSRLQNPVTRRLSRSWPSATLWFGITALLLVICRVEEIQFFAMRFLWVVWAVATLLYLFFQIRQFRARHYEVIREEVVEDPREKYLPKAKR